jgi:hypothetical protein
MRPADKNWAGLAAMGLPVVVLVAAVLSGCAGSLDAYETEDGSPTFLDGTEPKVQTFTVSEAVRVRPQEPVYVEGYLLAARDDDTRLCTVLSSDGHCRAAPSLVVDARRMNLDGASALEAGCCALGLWSPHPVVLRLRFRRGRPALVLGHT